MFKKLVLTLALCCTLSAVSNANWLVILFSPFAAAVDSCKVACHTCILDGNVFACSLAKHLCTEDECPPAYMPLDVN